MARQGEVMQSDGKSSYCYHPEFDNDFPVRAEAEVFHLVLTKSLEAPPPSPQLTLVISFLQEKKKKRYKGE